MCESGVIVENLLFLHKTKWKAFGLEKVFLDNVTIYVVFESQRSLSINFTKIGLDIVFKV